MHVLGSNTNLNRGTDESSDSVLHIVRLFKDIRVSDQRGPTPLAGTSANQQPEPSSVVPQIDDGSLSAYPAHILDTAIQCQLTHSNCYILWRQVLAYWFPSSEGFTLACRWRPAFLEGPGHTDVVDSDLVVLFQEQPILLLNLQEESNSERDLIMHRRMRTTADKIFDAMAVWSGQPAICVISAVASKWSMFVRPTEMTSAMVQQLVGYDWYGDFKDDVWSTTSYQALRQYFRVLKISLAR